MKERPILFSGAMVRAILSGQKTQTRRVVTPSPDLIHCGIPFINGHGQGGPGTKDRFIRCPYGQPGDRLWVRETFIHEPADYCWEASVSIPCQPETTVYRADYEGDTRGAGWTPSIHMPRSLSRITLEVTGVRVERLQDISRGDAMEEGCPFPNMMYETDPVAWFADLWCTINGPESWIANPWVWVVEFKRVQP